MKASAIESTSDQQPESEGPTKRRRNSKAPKPEKVSRYDRNEALRQQILRLTEDLQTEGYGPQLEPTGPVKLIAEPVADPKTGGIIGHVQESLGSYIRRVSVKDNFSQRPPFDHVTDSIYKRLIRDFIQGATLPEAKVAALSRSPSNKKTTSLDEVEISYSIIDGLQRLYCQCIAVLLVLRREELRDNGSISPEAWEYFKESISKCGDDARTATEKLLERIVRYEIFYNIDLGGLLHYMVTFNTAQRRMSLPVQLEIMQRPLLEELGSAGIPMYRDIELTPGSKRPKDRFSAADLILATEAFLTNNSQVTASTEAERRLEEPRYLENVGEINDVVSILKRLTTQIHPQIIQVYQDDATRRYIMSAGTTFLVGLSAACGYIRNRNNLKMLDGALDKLVEELRQPREDPLNLDQYTAALQRITASRGKAMRRLVNDTFLRFFTGASQELEWLDTVRQITGSTS